MLFNGFQYWIFFLIVVVLFYSVRFRLGKLILLCASYIFYMWWDPRFIVLILISTVVDYFLGIRLEAAKAEHWLRQGDLGKAKEFSETLFSTASSFKTRKYVAVAHRLRSEIAIAEGKPEVARAQYRAALDVLDEFPVPVVRWRVLAGLGKLLSTSGDAEGSLKAFNEAKKIVEEIAANVSDNSLRTTFMESKAVQEVMSGAKEV